MSKYVQVYIRFERGDGDFRTKLNFFCENVRIEGPDHWKDQNGKDFSSVYNFEYILDKSIFYYSPSKVMKDDNNKDLFEIWQEGKDWFAQIESKYVTSMEVYPANRGLKEWYRLIRNWVAWKYACWKYRKFPEFQS